MSIIDFPITSIIRSSDKYSGTNLLYVVNFKLDSSLYKYKYVLVKLVGWLAPHQGVPSTQTDTQNALILGLKSWFKKI